MVQVLVVSKLTLLPPVTLHTPPVVLAYTSATPEAPPVADTVKLPDPIARLVKGAKVITCGA